MNKQNVFAQIEGYSKIQEEIKILEKFGVDRAAQRGQVAKVINQLHPKTLTLSVLEIKKETASATTFRLGSPDFYLPPFQAGQYINLFVQVDGIRTSRPFSISSPPSQRAYYDIAVRRVPDGFVSDYLLNDVRVGDTFQSTSPSGYFYYNPLFHGNELVFLAGGSGITPFMSMIREITGRGLPHQIQLIYGNRTPDDIIFKDEMEERMACHENLNVFTVISEPDKDYKGITGFISADLIRGLVENIENKMFYVCGPEIMYHFVRAELEKLGIPGRRIRMEVSGPPANIGSQPGWPDHVSVDDVFGVDIDGKKTIQVTAGETLLNSFERSGIEVAASCRSGECSLCRTKLLSGKVFQPAGVKLRASDRWFGYIHPCKAYPIEDLKIALHSSGCS